MVLTRNWGFAGAIPILGTPADALDALIYMAEGDIGNAALYGSAILPGDSGVKTSAKVVSGAADAAKDVRKVVNGADDVARGAGGLVNGAKMTTSEALDAAEDFLGPGYKDMGNGRFVSLDGTRQVRMGDTDITGAHSGGSHMNFETFYPDPARPGRMTQDENIHIFLTD